MKVEMAKTVAARLCFPRETDKQIKMKYYTRETIFWKLDMSERDIALICQVFIAHSFVRG